MSEQIATETETTEAATTAETTDTASQLPQTEPPAPESTEESETVETQAEAPTEEQPATEEKRVQWDKDRQKRDEARAKREKEMLETLRALQEEIKTLKSPPATPAPETPAQDDIEDVIAQAEQATAKYKDTFDPADAAVAQELNAKANRLLLKRDREREQAIKAREERDTSTTEDQRRTAALHADWNKSGISVTEGEALIRQAFQRADARGLQGRERHAAAEMAYDLLLGDLKKSKKIPAPASPKPTTASSPNGKTPVGAQLTPRNSGVQPSPIQRGQAAKIIAADLGL
jgi:hypothetical protein